MYELRNGTKRLAGALYSVSENKATIARLAYYLNYQPGQLKQDITALNDYIRQAEENRDADNTP